MTGSIFMRRFRLFLALGTREIANICGSLGFIFKCLKYESDYLKPLQGYSGLGTATFHVQPFNEKIPDISGIFGIILTKLYAIRDRHFLVIINPFSSKTENQKNCIFYILFYKFNLFRSFSEPTLEM